MLGYTVRRIAQAIPVLFVAISLLFFLFFVLPGDPVDSMTGGNARQVDPLVEQKIREKYGFDKPVIEQFGKYWGNVLSGDLGDSLQDDKPVMDRVKTFAPNSLRLAFWALMLEIVI